jgi:LysM repeat protein
VAEGDWSATEGGPETADLIGDDDLSPTLPWRSGSAAIDPGPPPDVCRFLATEAGDGSFGPASQEVDERHRCIALGDGAPQSARQQQLVCLTGAHRNCPRYLRGVLLEDAPPPPRAREQVSRAVIAAALILVAAIAASFGFLAVRGGLTVALASPSPGSSQIALLPAASITPVATPSPAATPVPTPSVTASPSPSPVASPSPSPSPTPVVTPPPATATPQPSSDRYAVLSPCPSTPDCWIYTVRAGDNLVSIAHWFGVPLDTVYAMNPWARTTGLRAGQELRLPPPTR